MTCGCDACDGVTAGNFRRHQHHHPSSWPSKGRYFKFFYCDREYLLFLCSTSVAFCRHRLTASYSARFDLGAYTGGVDEDSRE